MMKFPKGVFLGSVTLSLYLILNVIPCHGKEDSRVGTTGFGFLKVAHSARPAGLGGAFVAVTGDVNSMGWNPASLVDIDRSLWTASYTNYLIDTQSGFAALSHPAWGKGTIGAGFYYMYFGSFTETDENGENKGDFRAGDAAAQVSFAYPLFKSLSLGVGIKLIYSTIGDFSSDAYALDLGLNFRPPLDGLSLGISALNLGFVRSGYSESFEDSLPAVLKLGFAHQLAHLPLMIAGELDIPNDNAPYFLLGGELTLLNSMLIRVSYDWMLRDISDDGLPGLSAGTGFLWKDYTIDYTYSSFSELGGVHRISLSGGF